MDKRPVFKLTQEGLENLKKEEQHLTAKRPIVVANVVRTREQGDLSENAGYHAAREELAWIDSRLKEVKYILRFAIVTKSNQKTEVAFGSEVEVESNGETRKFTIVNAMEADPTKNKISDSSPLGASLIGKKAGESVEVEMPSGKITYKVIEVN